MSAVGGSIESIAINNRLFPVAADVDASRDLGGFTSAVESNGNGSARILLTRKPWHISGVTVEVDDVRADHEFLQSVADAKEFVTIIVTLASGLSYQGIGTIVDKLELSTVKTTAQIELMGPQKLTQQ